MKQLKQTNLYQVLNQYATEAIELYRRKLSDGNKNASGALYNNITYEIIEDTNRIDVVLTLEDYWKYVEDGRKPGKFPPLNKIEEWIEIKPIEPYPLSNGKLPTPKLLAFLIGRKIATEGIEPTHYLVESIEELNNKYEDLLSKAIEEDLGLWLAEAFDEIFVI